MTGATGNLYCGLHEYSDMSFVLHLLRKEDAFADIGANIGSYTVLASGHVGARSFAFEPVASTFENLLKNVSLNNISDRVRSYNIALGAKAGTVDFTTGLDTVNHVVQDNQESSTKVTLDTL